MSFEWWAVGDSNRTTDIKTRVSKLCFEIYSSNTSNGVPRRIYIDSLLRGTGQESVTHGVSSTIHIEQSVDMFLFVVILPLRPK